MSNIKWQMSNVKRQMTNNKNYKCKISLADQIRSVDLMKSQ